MTRLADLTPREREIVALVAAGYEYADIARRLANLRSRRGESITVETVSNHVARIAEKIGGAGRPRRRIVHWFHEQSAA